MKQQDQFWLDLGVIIVLTVIVLWALKIICQRT